MVRVARPLDESVRAYLAFCGTRGDGAAHARGQMRGGGAVPYPQQARAAPLASESLPSESLVGEPWESPALAMAGGVSGARFAAPLPTYTSAAFAPAASDPFVDNAPPAAALATHPCGTEYSTPPNYSANYSSAAFDNQLPPQPPPSWAPAAPAAPAPPAPPAPPAQPLFETRELMANEPISTLSSLEGSCTHPQAAMPPAAMPPGWYSAAGPGCTVPPPALTPPPTDVISFGDPNPNPFGDPAPWAD